VAIDFAHVSDCILELLHGDQFYWWKKLEYPERTPTMGTQLVNFITCGCVSIAPF
jgi:hypothetical protein